MSANLIEFFCWLTYTYNSTRNWLYWLTDYVYLFQFKAPPNSDAPVFTKPSIIPSSNASQICYDAINKFPSSRECFDVIDVNVIVEMCVTDLQVDEYW